MDRCIVLYNYRVLYKYRGLYNYRVLYNYRELYNYRGLYNYRVYCIDYVMYSSNVVYSNICIEVVVYYYGVLILVM